MVCDKLTRQTHTQKTHYHRGLGEQDSGMPIDCKEHTLTLTLTPTTSNLGTPNHTTLRAFGLGEETGKNWGRKPIKLGETQTLRHESNPRSWMCEPTMLNTTPPRYLEITE